MAELKNIFLLNNSKIAFDKKHRQTLKFSILGNDEAVVKKKIECQNIQLAGQQVSCINSKVVSKFPKNLPCFEKNIPAGRIENIISPTLDLSLFSPLFSVSGKQNYKQSLRKQKKLDTIGGKFKNVRLKLNKNVVGKQKELSFVTRHSFSKIWNTNTNKCYVIEYL